MKLKVLVTPLTQGAYFAEHLDVAREEIRMLTGQHDAELELERFRDDWLLAVLGAISTTKAQHGFAFYE